LLSFHSGILFLPTDSVNETVSATFLYVIGILLSVYLASCEVLVSTFSGRVPMAELWSRTALSSIRFVGRLLSCPRCISDKQTYLIVIVSSLRKSDTVLSVLVWTVGLCAYPEIDRMG
jgi:hypothetical protein